MFANNWLLFLLIMMLVLNGDGNGISANDACIFTFLIFGMVMCQNKNCDMNGTTVGASALFN